MSTFLLHTLIITPACQWILQSGRWKKPYNLYYAIAFLVAVALIGESSSYLSQPPNFYHVLDVNRDVSAGDLKKAYRDASLRWHPDKNKSPDAHIIFQQINDAYSVLSDANARIAYDKFGTTNTNANRKGEAEILFGIATYYFVWSVLTYLLTIGKSSSNGRTWSFVGLIVALFVECNMLLSNWDPAIFLFKRMTQFDKIALMHSFYPAFMNGCRLISMFTFVDVEAQLHATIQELLDTNRDITLQLVNIQSFLEKKKSAQRNADGSINPINASESVASKQDESLPLNIRIKRAQEAERKAEELKSKAQKNVGIPSWVIMLGMYFVFNYLLK